MMESTPGTTTHGATKDTFARPSRPAPRVRGLPLVGVLPEMARLGTLAFFERQWRRHGDVFRVQLGPRRTLVGVHPDAIERVFGTNRDNYVKGPTYDDFRQLTGEGLLTLEGEAWRKRRRLEQPAFHRESIRAFTATMAQVTAGTLARWRARMPSGGVLDAHREMMRLTLEVVGETLFGQSLREEDADTSGRAFTEALALISERGNAAVRLPLTVPTPGNLRFRRSVRLLDEQVHGIIARARASTDRARRPTLLAMLLDARDADTGEALTDGELRNEVITLFLAGHETTALLLTWGFALLGEHPWVVRRMREEVDRVLNGREPTAEDVAKLTYVRQVVDEIMRVRPPVWALARDVAADDVVMGCPVYAGEVAMLLPYLTHRHPDFWREPDRFDPDRFAPEQARGRNHWAYLPFSLGPRMCIGNIFTLVEAQVVLAMLLQRLEFAPVPGVPFAPTPSITLRPNGPVPVRIAWRE